MKRLYILVILLFSVFAVNCYAAEIPKLGGEYEFNERAEALAEGRFSLSPTRIINNIGNALFEEIYESADIMLVLIASAALSGMVTVTNSAMSGSSMNDVTFFACFTMVATVAVKCFLVSLDYAKDVINLMSEFITKLSPMLLTMILSSGMAGSAAAFKPILSGAVYVITVIVDKCLVPLILFGAVLSIVNNISGKVQISGYTKLVQSVSKWILTAVLTMFTGITSIYGFTTPVLDALGARAAKFAVGSFVPVVGGLLSDSIETVVGGSMLVKNSIGTAGVITICAICLVPIIKIAAMVLILKLSAAAVEPLADKRITGLIQDIASVTTTIMAMVITVSVMFVICISIMIATTNR